MRRSAGDAAGASSTPVRTTTALTVVLPCYNEAERLPGTLRTLLAHLSGTSGQVEVLVVDDGSTDATVMVADAVAAVDRRVRVLSYQPNRGKGFAVRTGMLAAEGELIVFTDADGSYGPSELDRIVGALDEAPVAIGTRASGTSGPVARRAASRVFNLAIRGSLGLPFGDTQKGPGHGASRQQGSDAGRCPGDARRGVGDPAGEDERRLRQRGSAPDPIPRSGGQPYRSAAHSGEHPPNTPSALQAG
jgi:hypothetical protein